MFARIYYANGISFGNIEVLSTEPLVIRDKASNAEWTEDEIDMLAGDWEVTRLVDISTGNTLYPIGDTTMKATKEYQPEINDPTGQLWFAGIPYMPSVVSWEGNLTFGFENEVVCAEGRDSMEYYLQSNAPDGIVLDWNVVPDCSIDVSDIIYDYDYDDDSFHDWHSDTCECSDLRENYCECVTECECEECGFDDCEYCEHGDYCESCEYCLEEVCAHCKDMDAGHIQCAHCAGECDCHEQYMCEHSGYDCEIVSPVFATNDHLEKSTDIINELAQEMPFTCSHTEGLHVHIGIAKLSLEKLKNVAKSWIEVQDGVEANMIHEYRHGNYPYAGMNAYTSDDVDNIDDVANMGSLNNGDRYYNLNFTPCARSEGKRTIEFRMKEAVTDGLELKRWIEFCLGFVAYYSIAEYNGEDYEGMLHNVAKCIDDADGFVSYWKSYKA